MLVLLGVIIICIYGQIIEEITDKGTEFKVHSDVGTTVISLPLAWDGKLIGSGCELKQKQIVSSIELTQIVQYDENNLDAKSLTHVSHDDHQVAIMTSDFQLIVVSKKDYQSKSQFDISKYGVEEIHQIIVDELVVLIITNENAFIVYLSPFSCIEFKEWKPRQERWLSSIQGSFIYSAVGIDGIDVYLTTNLTYYRNINAVDLGLKQLCVRDFTIFNNILYILDCSRGLIIAKMTIYENVIDFTVRQIDIQEGGIAVDTKNGHNVFVGYKWRLRHAIVEYIIDESEWRIQNLVYVNRIKDVDANTEYALVQGVGRHMVAFNYGTQLSNSILKFNVRDFELRNNEIIGITMTQLFRSQLLSIPLKVDCFISNNEELNEFYLFYNVSENASVIERHHLRFTVDVINTYLYSNQSYGAIIASTLLFCVITVIIILMIQWYISLRKEEKILTRTINKYSLTIPTSGRTNTLQSTRPLSPTHANLILSNFEQQQKQ